MLETHEDGQRMHHVFVRQRATTMAWACMLWCPYAFGTQTFLWFEHGCSGDSRLLEHDRFYGLGMDALVTVCSWNTIVIMVWAWILR